MRTINRPTPLWMKHEITVDCLARMYDGITVSHMHLVDSL